MISSTQKKNVAALAFGVMASIFGGKEIYERAAIDLKGKVVLSETDCVQPYNNRCSTKYIVQNSENLQATYIAGPTDKSLRRQLPVGTEIHKNKWSLTYSIDGQEINDFPVIFYGGALIFGVAGICFWFTLSKSST